MRVAQALFYANAAIWVVLAAATVWRMAGGSPEQRASAVVIAVLMLGNAGAMLVSGVGLGRPSRLSYLLAVAVLLVNIVLTVTDQVGLLDVLTGVLDLVLLGFLIAVRKRYCAPGR
jgi:hypothetical protein